MARPGRTTLVMLAALAALGAAPSLADAAEPIKLGAFFALSGPAASIGTPTKLVAELAVKKINAEGGVNGRPIELVTGDTESEATKAATIFKKFVSVDKVMAVVGPTRTDTGMAVKKQVEQAKLPTVMTVGGDAVIMEGKLGNLDFGTARYVFKTPQRSSLAAEKVLAHLKSKGLTRIALLTASDGFGRDGLRWLEKIAPEMGFILVAKEQFNPSDVDMKSQLAKIAGLDPQAIVCWTIGPAGAIVSKNHHALGIKAPLVQCHGLPSPRYLELAGPAAEGDIMPSTKLMIYQELPDSDPQKPVIAEFVRLYTEAGYQAKFPIDTHSGYAWDAVYLVVEAFKRAGGDPAQFKAALEATRKHVGVSGIFNLSPQDHNGLGTDSLVMVQVKDGKFTLAK